MELCPTISSSVRNVNMRASASRSKRFSAATKILRHGEVGPRAGLASESVFTVLAVSGMLLAVL